VAEAPPYAWPDLLPARRAAEYLGVAMATLRRYRLSGRLLPAGRRGGVGAFVYARADLDRFLRGASPSSPVGGTETPRVQGACTAAALARLERLGVS
jgi:hypothetical protein